MKGYTISQLATMAGVSVRTLHHYDHIGLLKPLARTEAGYRLYGEQQLLRLQQILFFKELALPLDEIRAILDDPGFDQVEALKRHRLLVQEQVERLTRLLKTIDKTMQRLTEDNTMMTDEELYEGFTKEQMERYQHEAREMFNPQTVQETEDRLRAMPKGDWKALKAEGETVTRLIADQMERDPSDPEVQALIARHHAMIEHFYPAPAEVYRGLGQLYVENDEFRAYYEAFRPGLADFMQAAMVCYVEHTLSEAPQADSRS